MQFSVTNMKPILIDALHINMGGALMILNHLVNRLTARNIDFVLLKDIRCPILQSEKCIPNIVVLPSSSKNRYKFYLNNRNNFRSVLCLGNIPPCIKLSVPVYTYIHNVSILKIPDNYPVFWKIKNALKKEYIKFYAKNTSNWIVQTSNTANLVKKYLPCKNKQIMIYPFYHIPNDINKIPWRQRKDYVFIGEHTYAKGHEYLVEAWRILSNQGFKGTLHLTVASNDFKGIIEKAVHNGTDIINHGRIDFNEVVNLYNQSKAIIYPSLNESLGLGIIEAIEAGCDVIGSDLPYLHSVCNPSKTFKYGDVDSIVNAVLEYEKYSGERTTLKTRDMSDELITLLDNNYF